MPQPSISYERVKRCVLSDLSKVCLFIFKSHPGDGSGTAQAGQLHQLVHAEAVLGEQLLVDVLRLLLPVNHNHNHNPAPLSQPAQHTQTTFCLRQDAPVLMNFGCKNRWIGPLSQIKVTCKWDLKWCCGTVFAQPGVRGPLVVSGEVVGGPWD